MRSISMVVAVLFAVSWGPDARALAVDPPAKSDAPRVVKVQGEQLACRGCGCRGGAGYRLPNGKCAPRGR